MSTHDERRNSGPRVGAGPFWSYMVLVTVAGLTLLGVQLGEITTTSLDMMGGALIAVAALIVLGEVRPLVIAGTRDANGVSTSTAFVFALLLHTGLPVALMIQAGAAVIADVMSRKAPFRTAFNVAQFSLSYAAAAAVFGLFGYHPSGMNMLNVSASDLPAIAVAGLAYFIVNTLLVAQAVALLNHTSLRHEVMADLPFQAASTVALLGLAPIIVVVMNRGPGLLPLMLFPLAAVYATASMTRQRERHALHDPLTGLPNRTQLDQLTTAALEEARCAQTQVGLCLLDLDRFKEINDTLGHQVGDALLKEIGRRITETVGDEGHVARLGGDEFAVLMPMLNEPRTGVALADRLHTALAQPFRHDVLSYEVQVSVGMAFYPQHGNAFEVLLQRADIAMYVAKENGTGVQVYSADSDRNSTTRLSMVTELRAALDDGHLEVYYQPKADLRTGDVIGVEALLRWHHPERGMIPPEEFIPLAEQTGLMRHITLFVLDEVLRQLRDWWRRGLPVQAAVNASARDLYDRTFAESLRTSLDHYGVPPRALMLEVTESVLMADPARAASTLTSLAELGVGVSLDDFGTGYSSLVHLKRLPVSEVKIDRSFVMRMDANDDDAAIVRSIVDLASALGLRTVAEGVETQTSWDRLVGYGCDAAQGWLLARAMPAADATQWLLRAMTRPPTDRPAPSLVATTRHRVGSDSAS